MNTEIKPGLTSFDTKQNQRYRFYGIVRGNASDAEALSTLTGLGFVNLTYFPDGAVLPSDWPGEDRVPLKDGERNFRAEGIWSRSTPLPTAAGPLTVFQLWAADSAATQTSASFWSMPTDPTSKAVGIGAAFLFLGFVAAGILIAGGKQEDKPKQNPIRYDSSIKHRGITIHVHATDNGYCADYSAVGRVVRGAGGQACATDKSLAVLQAKHSIDRVLT